MALQSVEFRDLQQMDYKTAWDLQERLLQQNVRIKSAVQSSESGNLKSQFLTPDSGYPTPESELTTHYLLFVEHPPVYTLGKSGKMENVIMGQDQRSKEGIEFFSHQPGRRYNFSWSRANSWLSHF